MADFCYQSLGYRKRLACALALDIRKQRQTNFRDWKVYCDGGNVTIRERADVEYGENQFQTTMSSFVAVCLSVTMIALIGAAIFVRRLRQKPSASVEKFPPGLLPPNDDHDSTSSQAMTEAVFQINKKSVSIL